MGFIEGVTNNKAVTIPVLAWFVAQLIKFILTFAIDKKIDFTRLVGSGGMPSSHSSFTVSLAIVLGRQYGWDSPFFAIAAAFAAIVMYDAAGIRRAAGKQARVLNKLVMAHFTKAEFEEKLKELIGHSPFEVLMGALLGIAFGLALT